MSNYSTRFVQLASDFRNAGSADRAVQLASQLCAILADFAGDLVSTELAINRRINDIANQPTPTPTPPTPIEPEYIQDTAENYGAGDTVYVRDPMHNAFIPYVLIDWSMAIDESVNCVIRNSTGYIVTNWENIWIRA